MLRLSTTILLLALASTAHSQVRTIDLREMVKFSGMIFIGTVTDTHGALDEHGDIVTYTSFRIEQGISRVPGTAVTIKQFGGRANGLETYLPHMRYFRAGERVLVMLYPTSELGFTSPIGMSQAVWNISAEGRVTNIAESTFKGVEPLLAKRGLSSRAGSVATPVFVSMINELLQGGGR
jgi:hypothetical protein